jgi:hypothetical protein
MKLLYAHDLTETFCIALDQDPFEVVAKGATNHGLGSTGIQLVTIPALLHFKQLTLGHSRYWNLGNRG